MPPSPFADALYSPSGVPLPSFSGPQPPLRISTSRRRLSATSPSPNGTSNVVQNGPSSLAGTNGPDTGQLVVAALHGSSSLAEQNVPHGRPLTPTPYAGAPAFHAAGQPDPVVIDHNPFSESFGRPSGLGSADIISLDASLPSGAMLASEVDQNPFAAFLPSARSDVAGARASAETAHHPPQLQLPSHLDENSYHSPAAQQGLNTTASIPQAQLASELGGKPGAAVVLDCSLRGIEVKLPWDQDPGAAIRFTELWAKAFKQACLSSWDLDWSITCPSAVLEALMGWQSPNPFAEAVWCMKTCHNS